jgi:lysophospholipase L1-like esterase
VRAIVLGCVLLSVHGCGGDASSPADAAPTADAGHRSDSGGPLDGGTTADTGMRGDAGEIRLGHMSYVPPGLAPTEAARLIVMGDSISAGSGASGRELTYSSLLNRNEDRTWPAAMAEDLESKFGMTPEFLSVADGGDTTAELRNAQIGFVRDRLGVPVRGHSIVVITIGGNDLQGAILTRDDPVGELLDDAITNIRTVVTALQDPTDFPDGTSIYLMNVYDPSDGVAQIDECFFGLALPQFVSALDVWFARYVELGTELGFAVVDALGGFHGHGFYSDDPLNAYYDSGDPTRWFDDDCIHPNDRGHHEIRRLFFEAIDR